jgi:hypothetical protein
MVRQKNKSDCGIAAVANAVGISYRAVKERFGRMDRGGMLYHELVFIINEFGEWKRLRLRKGTDGKFPRLADWVAKHKTGRYFVLVGRLLEFHAAAVVEGEIMGAWPDDYITNAWRLMESTAKP